MERNSEDLSMKEILESFGEEELQELREYNDSLWMDLSDKIPLLNNERDERNYEVRQNKGGI